MKKSYISPVVEIVETVEFELLAGTVRKADGPGPGGSVIDDDDDPDDPGEPQSDLSFGTVWDDEEGIF